MLKILSASVATALFIAWPPFAYSFDRQRFSPINFEQTDAHVFGFHLQNQLQEEQFSAGPTGRVNRIPSDMRMNIVNSKKSQVANKSGGESERRSSLDWALNLNTRYSISAVEPRPNGKCGPSPMTAAEIEDLVAETARTYGVDLDLAKAVAWTESRFDQNRNSDKGARGTMQLMPSTALELGVRDVCDPASNIDGGVRYLKLMLDEFQNPILATAAYNAGAQAVYDNGGVPPYPETVRYVAAVVNHQMGLQTPRKSSVRGIASTTEPTPSAEIASDVIGMRGSRFIKGVMQF